MDIDARAAELQRLLFEDGIMATLPECRTLLIADLIEQIRNLVPA